MRQCTIAALVAGVAAAGPMTVERASAQHQNSEADKGMKTRNSGESGYVGDQNNPGAAATPPGVRAQLPTWLESATLLAREIPAPA